MKILVLVNDDTVTYNFKKELLSEMIKRGNEVYLSLPCGERTKNIEALGCRIIQTPVDRRGVNPVTDCKLMLKYKKIIESVKPDKILTLTVKPNIYGGIVAKRKRIPYYTQITGLGSAFHQRGFVNAVVKKLYKAALKKSNAVFFENNANMRIMLDKNIITSEQSVLTSGAGVNLKEYNYFPMTEQKANRLIFIGRLMKEKGIGELLEAVERLNMDKRSFSIDLYGRVEEEEYLDEVKKLEKAGNFRYFGDVVDLPDRLRNYGAVILPSYHEGMSNALLEAASSGLAVICSDIPGCCETVVDGVSGYICEAQNADSLYKAICKYLDSSYMQKSEMSLAGRRHMEKTFDRTKVVEETLRIMEL